MLPLTRSCTKCGLEKSLTQFSKAPRGLHGRKASCKACDAARHKADFIPAVVDEDVKRRRYTAQRAPTKVCTGCGEEKPREHFRLARQGKYGPVLSQPCKPCASVRASKWFRDNRERGRETKRLCNLRKQYGLTFEDYEAMIAAQGGVCAICGRDEPSEHGRTGKKFRLAVDHCHETDRIRGLLCQRCNRGIGLLGDDVGVLRKAIEYLQKE